MTFRHSPDQATRRWLCFTSLKFAAAACLLTAGGAQAQVNSANNESIKQECAQAIRRGVKFLEAQQDKASGMIVDAENPAITALGAMAIMGDPSVAKADVPSTAAQALDYLASKAQADGGIYIKGLANYNTSLCLTALVSDPRGKHVAAAKNARKYLIGLQQDNEEKGEADHSHDGGIGYGGSSKFSDLSNTHFALEALHYAQALDAEKPADNEPKLNYQAAIDFVSRCQNLKAHNKSAWVSEDEKNKGGFVYEPGVSKAGDEPTPEGGKALRSTGSISYAGLLSLIYAKMDPKDVRIQSVLEWLQQNYSATENPGLQGQGLYYYYHSMAKSLTLLNKTDLTLKNGKSVPWRQEIAAELFKAQKADGSWTNPTGRWRESDPAYATALAVLTLEHIYRSL